MSTRRARIKAVSSLPPRRKNAAIVENKTKPAPTKEDTPKVAKSPSTPRSATRSHESARLSPAIRPATPKLPGTPKLPRTPKLPETPKLSQANSPETKSVNTPRSQTVIRTPKMAEKVSVITSTRPVFASPPPRTESPIGVVASPIALGSKSTAKVTGSSNKTTPLLVQYVSKGLEDLRMQIADKVCEKLSVDNKSDTTDDYNVPSVPESLTEDTVMDGIVPLQPTKAVPKPIDLLKNEIISENAEVLFDPIVPLPSPSKVRPKLRPIPRLAPLRRNSIQGSASESEDESRRALLSGATTPAPPRQRHDSHTSHSTVISLANRDVSRIRNDSISSTISQATVQVPPAASPTKEKQYKSRRQEMSRRMAAMRRRRETVKRDALTMYDLIFYNPTENPIVPDQDEINAKEANKKDEAERKAAPEEDADDPPPADEAPVPQIKLGPNGEIILDEKSLVIKTTDTRKVSTSVVREGAWVGGGGKYTRSTRTADWSSEETVRFYRALAALGTDFTLMVPLFPDRSRKDLKLKFKKEERINGAQVDKALRSATTWDPTSLQEEFQAERAAAKAKALADKERFLAQKREENKRMALAKQQNFRRSKGSKALEVFADRNVQRMKRHEGPVTANEMLQRAIESNTKRTRRRIMSPPQGESPIKPPPARERTPKTPFTITPLSSNSIPDSNISTLEVATLQKIDSPSKTPSPALNIPSVPSNIEAGSLVVLKVNDPNNPTKKMLQTYIAHGGGKLTPVSLPPTFLNSVVGYMKKGTPRSSTSGSPQFMSPLNNSSNDSRTSTPGVIQLNPSPAKRQRHSSFTITQL